MSERGKTASAAAALITDAASFLTFSGKDLTAINGLSFAKAVNGDAIVVAISGGSYTIQYRITGFKHPLDMTVASYGSFVPDPGPERATFSSDQLNIYVDDRQIPGSAAH